MYYNEVSTNVMEMLLCPLDSDTLRNLYVKAPRKSIGTLPKKVPKKIKEKAINDLTTKKNMQYLLGKLNIIRGFYGIESENINLEDDFNYLQFEKMCVSLDSNVSGILLLILQEKGYAGINNFFFGDLRKVEKVRKLWLKIEWKNKKKISQDVDHKLPEQNKYQKLIASQESKNLLLSSRLKKVQNNYVVDLNNQKNKFLTQIKKEQTKYKENNEQKNKRIEELQELLNEQEEKQKEELQELLNEQEKKQDILQKNLDEERLNVDILKSRIDRQNKLIEQILQEKGFPIKVIVAKERKGYVHGRGYVYISSDSIEDIVDVTTVLNAEYLYLLQETTTPRMQYRVKKRLFEQKKDTKLKIISMIDLQGKGEK